MTNTTTTELLARATIAIRPTVAAPQGNVSATMTVRLPDGTVGTVSCKDLLGSQGGQDVEVRQYQHGGGCRRDLWWLSQLSVVA